MHRRTVLHAGLTALAGAAVTRDITQLEAVGLGQTPATTQSKPLGEHPLGPGLDGWQGTILEVTYPPGVESASHQHPGPTFGYVVSGTIRWAINGEPARVLGPGQSFFEPTGSVHSTSANASATEPARIAVVILGKPGDPLSKPASAPATKPPL
jgi:quercetin dioxygenase-like cupin family protein